MADKFLISKSRIPIVLHTLLYSAVYFSFSLQTPFPSSLRFILFIHSFMKVVNFNFHAVAHDKVSV